MIHSFSSYRTKKLQKERSGDKEREEGKLSVACRRVG